MKHSSLSNQIHISESVSSDDSFESSLMDPFHKTVMMCFDQHHKSSKVFFFFFFIFLHISLFFLLTVVISLSNLFSSLVESRENTSAAEKPGNVKKVYSVHKIFVFRNEI